MPGIPTHRDNTLITLYSGHCRFRVRDIKMLYNKGNINCVTCLLSNIIEISFYNLRLSHSNTHCKMHYYKQVNAARTYTQFCLMCYTINIRSIILFFISIFYPDLMFKMSIHTHTQIYTQRIHNIYNIFEHLLQIIVLFS